MGNPNPPVFFGGRQINLPPDYQSVLDDYLAGRTDIRQPVPPAVQQQQQNTPLVSVPTPGTTGQGVAGALGIPVPGAGDEDDDTAAGGGGPGGPGGRAGNPGAAAAARAQARRDRAMGQLSLRIALWAQNAGVSMGNWPRPGGIALLLAIILFIVFAIQPMGKNGHTRLELIWLAMFGKVELPTSGKETLAAGDIFTDSPVTNAATAIGSAIKHPFLSGAANSVGSALSDAGNALQNVGNIPNASAETLALPGSHSGGSIPYASA